MGEGAVRCLVWWNEQWHVRVELCPLSGRSRAGADQLAHHFFPGNSSGQPEPRAAFFQRLPSDPQSSHHHAAGLQTSNGQTTSSETPDLPKRRSSGSSEMGWHMAHDTVMAMATAARSGLSKRQPSSKLSTSSSCCCCRVDSRGHSGEWQTHAAASTGRSCLDSSPRPNRRLPEPQLVVMPCNSRPPCGEPSIVVWHGGGTTPAVSSAPGGPKRTPAWPPRGPLQPLAACQTQGQTGSSPFRP